MQWRDHIERNPQILAGKPVVKGTRIAVELILERLSDGWSEQQVLDAFPQLTAEHVRAALAYAAVAISSDEIVFLDANR